MKLYVHKNPDQFTRANCLELSDDAPHPGLPYELMTKQELETWLAAQPPLEVEVFDLQAKLLEGWFDEVTGRRWKTTNEAQARFTSAVVLNNLAISAGLKTVESDVDVWDYNDEKLTLSGPQFMGLMLRYGAYIQSLIG